MIITIVPLPGLRWTLCLLQCFSATECLKLLFRFMLKKRLFLSTFMKSINVVPSKSLLQGWQRIVCGGGKVCRCIRTWVLDLELSYSAVGLRANHCPSWDLSVLPYKVDLLLMEHAGRISQAVSLWFACLLNRLCPDCILPRWDFAGSFSALLSGSPFGARCGHPHSHHRVPASTGAKLFRCLSLCSNHAPWGVFIP